MAAPAPVPFFRPSITEREVLDVVEALRSGWLTTGPRTARFEREFARAVNGAHAVALNSCTAALHLAVQALGLSAGQAVLVPTMTFAATAEIVRYLGGVPIFVDCDPATLNLDLEDAERKIAKWTLSHQSPFGTADLRVVGIIPVHVGGYMMAMDAVAEFARRHELWVVEDAAHAFPAAWRPGPDAPWISCGANTAHVTCFSFYANKTITTGEGGMAVTNDESLAETIRSLSLHGLSHDAWSRYSGGGSWDYQILSPGYKYNMTDTAAALGIQQLARAEMMRAERERIAAAYTEAFAGIPEIETPTTSPDRIHSWHLYPIRCRPELLDIDRNAFICELKDRGIGCSVHWRPLHLHPYYRNVMRWHPEDCPVATDVWQNLISLPVFPEMHEQEFDRVVNAVRSICASHARSRLIEEAEAELAISDGAV